MQLYLFDGINGTCSVAKEYQGRANWTFPSGNRSAAAAASSGSRKDYGQEVGCQLKEAARDIVADLPAHPSPPGSWPSTSAVPTSNLGRRNGVKLEDQFRVPFSADYVDRQVQG